MRIKLIIILIVLALLSFSNSILSEEEEEACEYDNGWNYVSLNKKLDNSELIMAKFYSDNGDIGFCMEPTVKFLKCGEYFSENYSKENIEEVTKVISAYRNLHGDDNLYIAAQLMIWDIIGQRQSVDGDIGYAYGREEIEKYIKTNYQSFKPKMDSFQEIELGKEYALNDDNNLIQEHYKATGSGFDYLEIQDNQVHFSTSDIYPIIKEIKLNPKVSTREILSKDSIIYVSDTSQNIIKFNSSFPISYEPIIIKVKHKTGDLIVNKMDEWGNYISGEATFHLYKSVKEEDSFILEEEIFTENGSLWTTNDSILKIEGVLPAGYYFLQEESAEGYKTLKDPVLFEIVNDNITAFNLYNENEDVSMEIRKTNTNGEKIYGAEFTIYDISSTLDSDGSDTIIGTGIEDVIVGENNNLQFQGDELYKKENIYLIKSDAEIAINSLLINETYDGPVDIRLSNDLIVRQLDNDYLKALKCGYVEFEIYKGQYPKIYVMQSFGNYKVFDEDDNDITAEFSISEIDDYISFKNNKLPYSLSFSIPINESDRYLHRAAINFPVNKNELLNKGRIYVMDELDVDYKMITGLKIYQNTTFDSKIQIQNIKNHNLFLANYDVKIYTDKDVLYRTLRSDENGNIDVNDFEVGEYYYEINGIKKYFTIPLSSESLTYDGLKYARDYMICETKTPNGYDYVSDPCQFISEDRHNYSFSLDFVNDIRVVDIVLYKTNTNRSILLDGAIFEVTKIPYKLQEHLKNNDELLPQAKEKYITGGLIIENRDDYKYMYLMDTANKVVRYDGFKELVLDDLVEGIYKIYFSNDIIDDYKDINWIEKKVIEGGFVIENLMYDFYLDLKEVEAPNGYVLDDDVFKIMPNLEYGRLEMNNYRINQAIIIPNTSA